MRACTDLQSHTQWRFGILTYYAPN